MRVSGKKRSFLLLGVLAIAVFVTVFELVKILVFPNQSVWESHVITIVSFSILSTAVASILLGKPQYAPSHRVSMGARMTAHLGLTGGSVAAGMKAYEVLKTRFLNGQTAGLSEGA
jgi:hypothetical protein